jgi:hypothetical protein
LLIESYACHLAAAEAGSRWWPFGRTDAEELAPDDTVEDSAASGEGEANPLVMPPREPSEEEPEPGWMIDSPLAKVSWPRLHMPELPRPKMPPFLAHQPEAEADRNTWAEPDSVTPRSSPWQAMTDGARRVGDRSQAAWDKTIDALTPGGNSENASSRVARRDQRQPWWKRMFRAEDRPPQSPETVSEWMAQERLDP